MRVRDASLSCRGPHTRCGSHPRQRVSDGRNRQSLTPIDRMRFRIGEVYLFSPAHRPTDASSCLWGVVNDQLGERLHMEILSYGFSEYCLDCFLPEGFRYARLATRDELRDFVYNVAYREGACHPH